MTNFLSYFIITIFVFSVFINFYNFRILYLVKKELDEYKK